MIEEILEELRAHHYKVEYLNDDVLRVRQPIGEYTVSLKAAIPPHFPAERPEFYLENWVELPRFAHVSRTDAMAGLVCGGTSDTIATGLDNSAGVFRELLERVVAQIARAIEDPIWNETEIRREFRAVWREACSPESPPLTCLSPESEELRELIVKAPVDTNGVGLVRDYLAAPTDDFELNGHNVYRRAWEHSQRTVKGKGCLIALPTLPLPPVPGDDINAWWGGALQSLSLETQKTYRHFAKHHRSRVFWIVFTGDTPSGITWCAIRCSRTDKAPAPLTPSFLSGWSMQAHEVTPINKAMLLPRGGGDFGLQGKVVGVVGIGSIGGTVAVELAKAGVGRLHLMDYDLFTHDNLYRHALSARYLGRNKAMALAHQLEEDYPFCKASGHPKVRLLDLPEAPFWESLDLIVVAIGDPTQERYFDRLRQEQGWTVPVLYTWVESHGVGGHAVLCHPEGPGCLACAYIGNQSGVVEATANLNFLQSGQQVARNHAGCGSLFFPYSGIDADQTAAVATRLGVQALCCEVCAGTSLSWRGSAAAAEKELLRLTHRFHRAKNLDEGRPLHRSECHVCN